MGQSQGQVRAGGRSAGQWFAGLGPQRQAGGHDRGERSLNAWLIEPAEPRPHPQPGANRDRRPRCIELELGRPVEPGAHQGPTEGQIIVVGIGEVDDRQQHPQGTNRVAGATVAQRIESDRAPRRAEGDEIGDRCRGVAGQPGCVAGAAECNDHHGAAGAQRTEHATQSGRLTDDPAGIAVAQRRVGPRCQHDEPLAIGGRGDGEGFRRQTRRADVDDAVCRRG